MISPTRLESRCIRISDELRMWGDDEIALLRGARVLKGILPELRRSLWERTRREGWTDCTIRLDTLLDTLERELRRALLEYSSLSRVQLHEHLIEASGHLLEAVELLHP